MMHRHKFISRHLPIVLSVILVLAAGLIYFSWPKQIEKQIDGIAGSIDTTTPHPSDVMIRFEREYNGIKYKDALNFTQEEYDALTRKEIIKMEDERFNNWVTIITAPPQEEATSTDQ